MFLLLLAIADDAGGLIILAVFYPQGALAPAWLLLSFGAALAVYLLANRLPRRWTPSATGGRTTLTRRARLLAVPLAGCLSWSASSRPGSIRRSGCCRSSRRSRTPTSTSASTRRGGGSARPAQSDRACAEGAGRGDPVLLRPDERRRRVLGDGRGDLAGARGARHRQAAGDHALRLCAARALGLGLPRGCRTRDLLVLGCVAAIGFTVALFVASVAFPPGPVQDAAKMGALFSFGAAADRDRRRPDRCGWSGGRWRPRSRGFRCAAMVNGGSFDAHIMHNACTTLCVRARGRKVNGRGVGRREGRTVHLERLSGRWLIDGWSAALPLATALGPRAETRGRRSLPISAIGSAGGLCPYRQQTAHQRRLVADPRLLEDPVKMGASGVRADPELLRGRR